MRTVFSSNNEAAHIWASQSQTSGRAGNVFFEDGVIYSYGRHFPVARFAPEFGDVVLFNNRGYSNSTGKHKSLIRAAIPGGFNVVYCDDPTRSHQHNLDVWARTVERLRADFAAKTHKMTRGNIAVEIFKTCESAISYCIALRIGTPPWVNETNDEMTARDYVYELAKARDAKREAARIEREKLAAIDAGDRIALWQAGEKLAAIDAGDRIALWQAGENVPQNGFQYCSTFLRLKNDQIQTSRGAQIPVADALKLWPLLVRVKNSGKTLEAGLHQINLGAYRFNSFDGATLVVGCHSIAWDQLELMADQLNLTEKA